MGLIDPIVRRKRNGEGFSAGGRRGRQGPFHGDRNGNIQGQKDPGQNREWKQ
jgi:hypothetical protein